MGGTCDFLWTTGEQRVPDIWEEVPFPLGTVEVVRGLPDVDSFLSTSHVPIRHTLQGFHPLPVYDVVHSY